MNPYIAELTAYLSKHPPNYGYYNANSLLDMLYGCYTQYNPVDSADIKHAFNDLNLHLRQLPLQENDAITDIVCSLCSQYEHLAFITGIHVGIRLCMELK